MRATSLLALATLVAGCGSSTSRRPNQTVNSDTGSGYTVRTTDTGGGAFSADVFDSNGALVMRYVGPDASGNNRWTTFANGQPTMNDPAFPAGGIPYSADSFGREATHVYIGVSNAQQGLDAYDSQGCSGVSALNNTNSGACCDRHDECYCRNNCTWRSWLPGGGSAACRGCNSAVVSCVVGCQVSLEAPARDCSPSSCVAAGTCGRSWPTCCNPGVACQCMPPPGAANACTIASGNACPPCPEM